MNKNITLEGKNNLIKQLEILKQEKKETLLRLSDARGQGDLKENNDYSESKLLLSKISQEINEIQHALEFSKVVKTIPGGDVVKFGSKVMVLNLETQAEKEYTIVSETESDVFLGLLAESTPMAKILINRKVNEVVTLQAPSGAIKNFKILKILN